MENQKPTETRESDFDRELTYSLFDEYMERVYAGELTMGQAIEGYTALMRLGAEGLHGSHE